VIKLSVKMSPDGKDIIQKRERLPMADSSMADLAQQVNENILDEAPHKTGKLAKAHKVRKLKRNSYELYVDSKSPANKYYLPVRFGTGPRVITPKAKKALMWPGARHPVKIVKRWPGIKGNDYVNRAIDSSSGDIRQAEENMANAIEKAI